MWVRACCLLVVAAGCIDYDEVVHVRVRDPRAVSVAIAPGGSPVLERGPGVVDLPHDQPPFLEDRQADASVERDAAGAVAAQCASCAWDQRRQVVAADGAIDLTGTPAFVARCGDLVDLHYEYVAPVPCPWGRRRLCNRPLFALELATPRDNLTGVDFSRHAPTAQRTGGKFAIATGAVLAGAGLAMIGAGVWDQTGGPRRAAVAMGSVFTAVGTWFVTLGVATLRGHDTDTPLAVP